MRTGESLWQDQLWQVGLRPRGQSYEVYGIGTSDVHRGHAVPITDPVGPAEVSATY